MARETASTGSDPEITAIAEVHQALKLLDADAQARVIQYVSGKLGISAKLTSRPDHEDEHQSSQRELAPQLRADNDNVAGGGPSPADGISAIAVKWMMRNQFNASGLGTIYSVGGDEIDLIAQSVPGDSKRKKMYHVLLLKAVAAYLASGVARVSHEQLKETCLHYDAYDATNFAKHLKDFAADVSGSKQAGYTLTARGLAAATTLLKGLIAPK